jgi:hypothetical protein
MLEWRLREEGRDGSAPGNTGQAKRSLHAYLLPCHKLFHGYPSPEEKARAVRREIPLCKILDLKLLNILDKPSRKHMVFPLGPVEYAKRKTRDGAEEM